MHIPGDASTPGPRNAGELDGYHGYGRDFTPAPEGLQRAICADVVDLGMEESQWGAKHKVRVYWQLEERDEDGRRFIVVKKYTLSLHRKSSLCADLTSWRY